jgi:hypothetical protein
MKFNNRTFHLLQTADILTCYEQLFFPDTGKSMRPKRRIIQFRSCEAGKGIIVFL